MEEEEEEKKVATVAGRRGLKALGEGGILLEWGCTFHGTSMVGEVHGGGVTQWDFGEA